MNKYKAYSFLILFSPLITATVIMAMWNRDYIFYSYLDSLEHAYNMLQRLYYGAIENALFIQLFSIIPLLFAQKKLVLAIKSPSKETFMQFASKFLIVLITFFVIVGGIIALLFMGMTPMTSAL